MHFNRQMALRFQRSWGNWEGAKRLTPIKPSPVVGDGTNDVKENQEYEDSGIRFSDSTGSNHPQSKQRCMGWPNWTPSLLGGCD
jgi:hypothetical protein